MASTSDARTALEARRTSTPAAGPGDQGRVIAGTVRQVLDRQASELALVLPPSMDADRFARLVVTAVKRTPQLLKAFGTPQGQQSILLAAMECATIGLEPNTPTQQAWIVPRQDHGVWEGRLWIGYRGLLTLVRRAGTVKELVGGVVREADEFAWSRELDRDTLRHVPGDGDRGKATHAYAIARMLNGGVQFVVLTRAEVEARRASSDSWSNTKSRPFSPWSKWPDAMWMKSAVRSLVPWLDLSGDAGREVGRAMAVDERRLVFDPDDLAIEAADDDDDVDLESAGDDAGADDEVDQVAAGGDPAPTDPPPADDPPAAQS